MVVALTFVIAIKSKNGIVFASDMQATDDYDLKYKVKKILNINNNMLVGFAGDMWFAKRLYEVLKTQFKKESEKGFDEPSAERLANTIGVKIAEETNLREKLKMEKDFSGADMIIATINKQGELGLLTMDSSCIPDIEYESGFTCIGNADHVIHPFIRSILEKVELDDLSLRDMEVIACRAVIEAHKWVNEVGEGIDMWTLSKEKGAVHLGKFEIDSLINQVEYWKSLEHRGFQLIRDRIKGGKFLRTGPGPELQKNKM
jgi:20S proteasome alpha/beta subunit